METAICRHCEKIYTVEHGNNGYCPNKNCQKEAKKKRQKENYPIGNDAKKAIQRNYKLFMELLEGKNSVHFDLMALLKLGFDQFGYYGCYMISQKIAMQVHEFYFHITTDNPQKIEIWKK